MRPSGRMRSPRPALWTGRAALALLFAGMLFGGAVSAPEALALCVALSVVAALAWGAAASPIPMRRLAWPAAGLLLSLLVAIATALPIFPELERQGLFAPVGGVTLSIAPSATLVEAAKLGAIGCAFVCGFLAGGGRRATARLSTVCVALTTGWAVWALLLLAITGGGRLDAPFLSPNTAATLLGVGSVLTLGRLLARRHPPALRGREAVSVVALGGAFATQLFALMLTQSRAGIAVTLLALAGLAVASWMLGQRQLGSRRWVWPAAAAAAATALLVAEAGREVLVRMGALGGDAGDRSEIFALYARAFTDAPTFGAGLGSATYITKLGLTAANYDSLWNVQSAHNWLLQWLAEGGLAGSLPMFAAVALVLWRAFLGLRATTAPLLLPLLFANAVVLGHGLTDFGLQIPALAFYWSFLVGLQLAIAERPGLDAAVQGASEGSVA